MIHNTAEIIKTNKTETTDTKELVAEFATVKVEIQGQANAKEADIATLQLELMEIQTATERKEEAEKQGKEIKEKMQEAIG